jgi:poly(3-hydroxybutyrate) depolymerase
MKSQHSRRAVIVIAALSIVVAGLGAGLFVRRMQARAASLGDLPGSLDFDGRSRAYFVHLPPGYTGKQALPLVLVLHGATESPEAVEKLSGISVKADKENFIVVYPRGTGRLANVPT